MTRLFRKLFILSLFGFCSFAYAEGIVTEIEVQGLSRVTPGLLLSSIDIQEGESISDEDISQAIKDIFSLGFFNSINIDHQEDGRLIIRLEELPVINEIDISGTRLINRDQILSALETNDIKEGEILRNTQLRIILRELTSLYAEQGRYGTNIDAQTEEIEGSNLVNLNIEINEGEAAKISRINIIGNDAFSDAEIKQLMGLKAVGKFNSLNNNVKYSRSQLLADIDTISRFYLNNGYARVSIEETSININRRRDLISLNIQINENRLYNIGSVQLIGDTVVPREQALAAIFFETGDSFSQREISNTQEEIGLLLGEQGYGLARISVAYNYDDQNSLVDVNIYVAPGQRTYIRNIEIVGNRKTSERVFRRYLQQYEASPYIASNVQRSLAAIRRLPYIANAQVETREIPGQPDKLDLVYSIEETPSGNIGGGLFWSDLSGISISAMYSDSNFLGSGNSLSAVGSYSLITQRAAFRVGQPFLSIDGLSADYFISYTNTNFNNARLANYALSSASGGLSFGYPLSFTNRINFGIEFAGYFLTRGRNALNEVTLYTQRHGTSYEDVTLTSSISHNSLNRGFKPTRGHRTEYSLGFQFDLTSEGRVPIYEMALNHISYYSFSRSIDELALSMALDVQFFDSLDPASRRPLPFYQNYFAGGFNSVRGYTANTLGPRGTRLDDNGNLVTSIASQGGNLRTTGKIEFIFPFGAIINREINNLRTSFFYDVGNVFLTRCVEACSPDANKVHIADLRHSVGLSIRWYIQFFPLSFAIAYPINPGPRDGTMFFQFTLGDFQF